MLTKTIFPTRFYDTTHPLLKSNAYGKGTVSNEVLYKNNKGSNLMNNNNGFWNEVKGNWKQFTGSVQERWGNLTNDEITAMKGERKQLVGKIQERYGIAQQEAESQVDEWAEKAISKF